MWYTKRGEDGFIEAFIVTLARRPGIKRLFLLMSKKELQKLKERFFAANVKRTGIPIEYYELPQFIIDNHERWLREQEEKREQTEMPDVELCPRGEIIPKQYARREVGYANKRTYFV